MRVLFFTFIVVAGLFLSACRTVHINPAYTPNPSASALPTDAARPRLFVEGVVDRSNGLVVKQGFAPRTNKLMADVVRKAVLAELESLGIPLVVDPSQAQARLSVILTHSEISWFSGFQVTVNAVIKFTLKFLNDAQFLLASAQVVGNGRGGPVAAGVPGTAPDIALNAALADAMKQTRELFVSGDIIAEILAPTTVSLGKRRVVKAAAVRAPKSDIDKLPKSRGRPRNAHAVVIGVENYRQKLPVAAFAAQDARLMARYLIGPMGFPEENVAVLIGERASKSDFEKYFESWLPNRVETGDEVLVYFAGNGAPDPATSRPYLLPYNGDPMYLAQTGYPLERLYASLAKLPSQRITVVLDAGFSGTGERSVLAKGARPLVSVRLAANLEKGVAVIIASAADQVSRVYDEKGHGLLTYFLLKGIQQGRGREWKAIFDYAAPEVRRVARRRYNSDQTPQWRQR